MAPYGACGVAQSRARSNAQFETEQLFQKKNKNDRKCFRSKKKHARKFFRSKKTMLEQWSFEFGICILFLEFRIFIFEQWFRRHSRAGAVISKAQSSRSSDFEGTVEPEQRFWRFWRAGAVFSKVLSSQSSDFEGFDEPEQPNRLAFPGFPVFPVFPV